MAHSQQKLSDELGAIDPGAFAAALAETTQTLVCVLDREGRILVFNKACEAATGFRADDVLGRDARELVIPPEEAEAFGEMLRNVWTTGAPSPQVGHWLTCDGGRRLIAWSNKPVTGADGSPAFLVTSGLDITERADASEEVRALESSLEAKLEEVGRLAQEQTALRRVATLVAAEASPEQIFEAVSTQCARVLGANAAAVFRYEHDTEAIVVGRYDRDGLGAFTLGGSIPIDRHSVVGRVHATGEASRIDDYTDAPGPVAAIMRSSGRHSAVAAPITLSGRRWGAVAVTTNRADAFPPDSGARLRSFCELISLAVESSQAREELRASRKRVIQAADAERRRLERNLHDGAQQRLVSLALAVRLARAKVASDPDAAAEMLEAAGAELSRALEELRELARGLHPATLADKGLKHALDSLADRAPLPVTVEIPRERLPESIETAAYYIVSEGLANIAKHARASSVAVAVRREGQHVTVSVADDGRGGADPTGSGLVGLSDRAEAIGGSLVVDSVPGRGTVLCALLPLAQDGQ